MGCGCGGRFFVHLLGFNIVPSPCSFAVGCIPKFKILFGADSNESVKPIGEVRKDDGHFGHCPEGCLGDEAGVTKTGRNPQGW